MNIKSLGIWSSLLLALVAFSSCGVEENKSKVVINEILMTNETNFQDDYGVHSAWLELFNKSYSTVNVAANLLRCSDTPGDTATYFIPKGDVLTQMPPRQHLLFWADGKPNRGTFHENGEVRETRQKRYRHVHYCYDGCVCRPHPAILSL